MFDEVVQHSLLPRGELQVCIVLCTFTATFSRRVIFKSYRSSAVYFYTFFIDTNSIT